MKTLKCTAILLAFVALLLSGCSDKAQSPVSPIDQSIQAPASLQKSVIHNVTIIDFPLPPPYDVDPGVKKYLPNGNIHYKAVGVLEQTVAKDLDGNIDPLITGVMENYLSTMIDGKTGNGAAHGKTVSRRALGEEYLGIWETQWEGYRSYVGKQYLVLPIGSGEYHVWKLPVKLVGHGKGGLVDKMQMFLETTLAIYSDDAHFPEPIFWLGSGSGFYKEH